jgi:protein involved in polysaccharide export with SLBB domain
MRRIALILTLALLAAPVRPAPAQSAAVSSQGAQAQGTPWSEQPLRPGDIIRLRVLREPDMTGEFPINEDGVAVLPRVGRTSVTGESPRQLEARLVREYSRYLQQPAVEVTLLRRVQVLGAVRTPGLHPVDATMSVSDVLALAGGATTQGDPDRIDLIRGGQRIPVRLSVGTRIVDSPIQSGDQIYVPERSWFSRNSGIIAAGLTSLFIGFFTAR